MKTRTIALLAGALLGAALLSPAFAADAPKDAPKAKAKPAKAAESPAKPAAPRAQAQYVSAPSGWYAEFRAGLANPNLKDPDDQIDIMQRFSGEIGAPGPLRTFGNPPAFQLELGRRHGAWAWGVECQHFRERVHTLDAGTSTGSLTATSFMSGTDVRLVGTWRRPALRGFELGAAAGMSWAHYSEDFNLYVYPMPDLSADYGGVYDSKATFVAGPVVGWRRQLYGNTWITARGAWMWRDYGTLNGTRVESNSAGRWTTDADLVRIRDGKTASVDASGLEFAMGLSQTFGGKR